MIEFHLKYDVTSAAYSGPQNWNGTQVPAMYFELYMGVNPFAPMRGERDIDCTIFEDKRMNAQGCMVYDDWRGVALDYWDSSSTTGSITSNIVAAATAIND